MTDIDIERLRALAKTEAQIGQCNDTCLYHNTGCAVLALIERLEKSEAQRDRLQRLVVNAYEVLRAAKMVIEIEENK